MVGIVIAFPRGRGETADVNCLAGFMLARTGRPSGQMDRFDHMERLLQQVPGTALHGAGIDLLHAFISLLTDDAARLRQTLSRSGTDSRDLQAIHLLFTLVDDIMLMIDVDPLDAASKLRRLVQRYDQMKALITDV